MIVVAALCILLIGLIEIQPAQGTGRITPLYHINSTACIAENLRLTDRYICDSHGNIICVGGWSDPSTLCSVPVCHMNGKGCIHGHCIFPNVCACEVGWDGPNCNECIPLGGCKHGSCYKPMECNCEPGWTGGQCNKPKCEGCVNGCCHEPYKCICDFGWQGVNCTECQTLSNCKNGRCITHPFQCECFDGWEGLDCSKPICRPSCHPVYGYCKQPGECICKNGWTGRDCNICVPYPGCKGTCVNNIPWTCSDIKTPNPGNPDQWSQWSRWSTCSKTCGEGIQKRERTCADTQGVSGNCVGSARETRSCTTKNCKIDGNWARWTRWTPCSASCGTGSRTRYRSCSNPIPRYGGRPCAGPHSENIKCFNRFCPIDGRWSSWQAWGQCSASCGDGRRQRARKCDSPTPSHGGLACIGDAVHASDCNNRECPIDAKWAAWSQWTKCSKTCGEGRQERIRNCYPPQFGGRPCTGNSTTERDVIPCWIHLVCSVDGNWSNWGAWSACSTTCGDGSRVRQRQCNNPIPKFGGRLCPGNSYENSRCASNPNCPIDGKWNAWTQWSDCTATCNGGNQNRQRTCIQPQFGGKACSGPSTQNRQCGQLKCPVDGVWSAWRQWSSCSKTCTGGIRRRQRNCTPPQFGGQTCVGSSTEEGSCNDDKPCEIFGTWALWGRWSRCSKTCGDGKRTRSRSCPTTNCIGNRFDQGQCNLGICAVHGNWGSWQQWGRCSVTCGHGTRRRIRRCDSPPPQGGRHCDGNPFENEGCFSGFCSRDGNWGNWGQWSGCSATCGNATQTRDRNCDNPPPSANGNFCSGNHIQSRSCATGFCPIDGGFSDWTQWSPCTVECFGDRGDQVRRRFCNNPTPQFGGRNCDGDIKQKRFCTGTVPKQETNPNAICFHVGDK